MSKDVRVTILQRRDVPYKYGYNSPEEDYKKLLSLGIKDFRDNNGDGFSTFNSLPHLVQRFGLLKTDPDKTPGRNGVSSCKVWGSITKGNVPNFSELRGNKGLTYFSLLDLVRATAELNREAIDSCFSDCILQPLSEAIQAGPDGRNLLFHPYEDQDEETLSERFWNILNRYNQERRRLRDFYVNKEMLPFIQKFGLENFILSIDQNRFSEYVPNGHIEYSDAVEVSMLLSLSTSLNTLTKLLTHDHYDIRTEVRAPQFKFRNDYMKLFFPINSLFFAKDYHYAEVPIFETFRLFFGRYSNILIIVSEA